MLQVVAAGRYVYVYLVDGSGVHPLDRELWRPSAVRQQAEAVLLRVRVLHDRHHVHGRIRRYLPGDSNRPVQCML